MSKSVVLLLVLVLLTASCIIVAKPVLSSDDAVEDSWVSKAPMQVARSGLGVAVVNGKIYAIGGCNESGIVGTNEEYDPATDTWTFKKSMPTPRLIFAVAVYENKIYCIGGKTSSGYTGVNEVYDPATDTWETKTDMPTARRALQANVVNGKIYLTGGLPDDLNEVYDPEEDTWETKAPLPTQTGFVSAVIDNKIYSVGTYYDGGYISVTQIYAPDTNTWSTAASPPSSITGGGYSAAAVTTGETAPKRMYVFGGIPKVGEPEYFVRVYDPENDSWTFGTDPSVIRKRAAVAVVNDMIYLIGGFTLTSPNLWSDPVYTCYATNEQYTPVGYGTVQPVVNIVFPENKTYDSINVSLTFTVNKQSESLGYSLDGQENVTINGNTTIGELSNGLHNITVYAKDEFGNIGVSETVSFNVDVPFPTALVIAPVALVAFIGVGLAVYFKKLKR